jgi:hypothetical protein
VTWGTKVLESHGLIRLAAGYRQGRRWFELTTLGHAALSGALTALGRRLDTSALLARIDKVTVY